MIGIMLLLVLAFAVIVIFILGFSGIALGARAMWRVQVASGRGPVPLIVIGALLVLFLFVACGS